MIPVLFFFFLAANNNAAKLTRQVADSGRVLEIGVAPSERATPPPQIAPGAPPLVSFRYFEGQTRHRFGNLDLVMDDAGH
jgi:hypothetical protein